MRRLCFVRKIPGFAGPASFQSRLALGLGLRNIETVFGIQNSPYDAVLVIGGSRQLSQLRRARKRGIPIIQRLDGMNWLHRRTRTGLRHFLKAEISNLLLRLIRRQLSDVLIYQSQFAKRWWEDTHGIPDVPATMVYNGIPLDVYHPEGERDLPDDHIRLLMVEGNLEGGYEIGLESGIRLARQLDHSLSKPVRLAVAGSVPPPIRAHWKNREPGLIDWLGPLPAAKIPSLDRSAHLLFSGDPNPACPNAVLEALACGLPVVAYDTGAIPEILVGDAGRVAKYGGDVWKLEEPDGEALLAAALDVLSDQERYRHFARKRAEEAFGLDRMVDGYVNAIDAVL